MRLAARVEGIGLLGPGLAGWREARDALAGRAPYSPAATLIPSPEALPAVERRRAGKSVRISLAAGLAAAREAGREPRDLAAIFTSSTGDGENLHAICEALASDDRLISPTRFHNSVHNAPSGYWGIATGAMHASDCLAAFDASFAAGLLEAFGRIADDPSRAVVLIAYDAPYPEPLHAKRPIPDTFGVALVLSSPSALGEGRAEGLVAIETSTSQPTRLADPGLERMRREIPAARCLPLLQVLARGAGEAVIEYLDNVSIAVALRR